MRAVQQLVGNLEEFLEARYSGKDMSPKEIAEEISVLSDGRIQVSGQSIRYWLIKLGFPRRATSHYWKIYSHREKRIKAIRERWQDSEKRRIHLKALRTPQARKKKSEATKRTWRERRLIMEVGRKRGSETLKLKTRRGIRIRLESLVPQRKTFRGRLSLFLAQTGTRLEARELLGVSVNPFYRILKEEKIGFKYSPGAKLKERNIELVKLAIEREQLGALSPRERRVVKLRYLGKTPLTLEEIGQRMGVNRQRVNAVEKKALQKLRKSMARPKSDL